MKAFSPNWLKLILHSHEREEKAAKGPNIWTVFSALGVSDQLELRNDWVLPWAKNIKYLFGHADSLLSVNDYSNSTQQEISWHELKIRL